MTELRRFGVQNKLDRMWTLTCRPSEMRYGPHGRRAMKRRVEGFVRQLRKQLVGESFAYAYVFEECDGKRCGECKGEWDRGALVLDGEGHLLSGPAHHHGQWHVHLLVGQFLPHAEVAQLWGYGYVQYRKFDGGSKREGARAAASYGAKYVGKGFGKGEALMGQHRYERAQGFAVRCSRRAVSTLRDALASVHESFGGEAPSWAWSSSSSTGWRGPPAMAMGWR